MKKIFYTNAYTMGAMGLPTAMNLGNTEENNLNIQKKFEQTALDIASDEDHWAVAEYLLQHPNINVNLQDNHNRVASYYLLDATKLKMQKYLDQITNQAIANG